MSQTVLSSVRGLKDFGSPDACDDCIVIEHDLTKILKKKLQIKMLNDSKMYINVAIRNVPTRERKPMIDMNAEVEAYREVIVNGDVDHT